MKLFALLFCIALTIDSLSAHSSRQNVFNEMQNIQNTISNIWILNPYIPANVVKEFEELAAKDRKFNDGFENTLKKVHKKIKEVLEMQNNIEKDMKEAYAKLRRINEVDKCLSTIKNGAVKRSDIRPEIWAFVQQYVLLIGFEFKRFKDVTKNVEETFLKKFSDIIESCNLAREAMEERKKYGSKFSRIIRFKEIKIIGKKATKEIEDSLSKVDDAFKNEYDYIKKMKELNEKAFVVHKKNFDQSMEPIHDILGQ